MGREQVSDFFLLFALVCFFVLLFLFCLRLKLGTGALSGGVESGVGLSLRR